MRTTVTIDDELLARATELTGSTARSALLRTGWETLIRVEIPETQLVLLTTRLYCFTKIMTKSWLLQRRNRAMPDALFLVFTQPNTDQEEAEYNSWYDETHIPELLEQVEGFRSARRYRLAPHPSSTSWPWPPYLAVYEIAGKTPEQVAEVLENLRIARDSTLTMSPSLGQGDRAPVRVVYVPLDGQEQDEP
jgi:hypothetical protein